MWLRIACALAALLAMCFAALVTNAASATARALRLTELAQSSNLNTSVRISVLRSARHELATAWSKPLAWHAGALEVYSGSAFLESQLGFSETLEGTSARSAANAVRLSPLQPAAWFRLGLLDHLGVRNEQCEVSACLANSWRAGSVIDARPACERLQLARLVGLDIAARDERLAWYAASRPPKRDIVRCLDGFPRESVFYALLQQREATARAHGT